ncbi:MAG TPA: glycosyltransferase [Candidatus Bipolaricaulota bacterium]|nr:glycosyltransferase [Candidatus Bipolaricaulota bacterium]
MKILLVNKFFYPKGGAEISMFEQARLLSEEGHQVAFFSMHHPQNQQSDFDKYFVSYVDMSKPIYSLTGLKMIGRMIYSLDAKRKFAKMLDEFKPDVIHYHNIYHQISPSILSAAKERNIPSVMTVHDYKLICPNYTLFNKTDVCEKCKRYKYYQPVFQKCFKNSRLAGLAIAVESTIHRLMNVYQKNIDLFLTPSNFTKNKFVEWGWPEGKIRVLPHFIDLDRFHATSELKDYIISYSRLEMAKGYDTLIKVMRGLPNIHLKIIGSGPDEAKIKDLAKDLKNIEFIPHLGWSALIKEVSGARLVLNLSKYYETFGLTILEGMALGKVIVANQRGAMQELIDEEKTGYQVKVGDIESLKKIIESSYNDKEKLIKMGNEAREKAEKEYNSGEYYLKLMDAYNSLVARGGEMG